MSSTVRVHDAAAPDIQRGIPVHNIVARKVADVWQNKLRYNPGMGWVELLTQSYEITTDRSLAGESPAGVIRAGLSTAAAIDAFSGLVNLEFFSGFEAVPASHADWTTITSAENFLPAFGLSVLQESRLFQAGKGEAPDATFGLFAEHWGLARYSAQINLDEQDLINAGTVSLSMAAVRALGRAAAMVPGDLVYGLLMRNPVTARDGKAFFSTDHDNLASGGSSGLQSGGTDNAAALDTAMAAVAAQAVADIESGIPIPSFTQPKYLICSPPVYPAARRLARLMVLDDGQDIVCRAEPRMQLGVADPSTETTIAGSNTSWMLASPASIGPSVLLGGLGGAPRPQLRDYGLSGPGWASGMFGRGFDCRLDVGACLLDPRGLYWSTGA
jgi:hypothetical protein